VRRATRVPTLGAALLAATLTTTLACFTSPRPQEMPVALGPRGAIVDAKLRDGSHARGELLEVNADALVLLSDARVLVVPRERIESAKAPGLGFFAYRSYGSAPLAMSDDIAFQARYPRGVPPTVLTALLADARQSAPDTATAARGTRP